MEHLFFCKLKQIAAMKTNNSTNSPSGFSSLPKKLVNENFLHYVWKFKLFHSTNLKTVTNEKMELNDVGFHNLGSGPDFFNSKIKIGTVLWAGTVEIHVKSSDWYVHRHEEDTNYESVILHVVWEYDVPILRADGTEIPTLVLKEYVFETTLQNYQQFWNRKEQWILCENDISTVDDFVFKGWITRLYFERLEIKSLVIEALLKETVNDWEAVLFQLLSKNFGLKLNGEAFFNLAKSFDFSVVRKQQSDADKLASLLFGQAGFFEEECEDVYYLSLRNEYNYLKKKYHLTALFKGQFSFFRLRPSNFPTIRLAQLAALYSERNVLFSDLMKFTTLQQFYNFFNVTTADYWETHFAFGKDSKKQKKRITSSFVDLLLINTIIPLKYAYLKSKGEQDFEVLENLIHAIKPEKNSTIDGFLKSKIEVNNAFESKALLQLKNAYCNQKKCLQCVVGIDLLK